MWEGTAAEPKRPKGSKGETGDTMKKWYSLIDKVYRLPNLAAAYQAVRANKGAPGVDRVTVEAYGENLVDELRQLHRELKTGTYEPQPVRRVEIPKSDGGVRMLGVPAVKDRVVQQALLNVLQPIFEPDFHPSSYGYRPGRSCHQAVAKAERFLNRYHLEYVVDMDLSKCFDRLDHDLILESVNQKVSDGSVLKLIRKFLTAGVMHDGALEATDVGSAQGGVCSPLIANIYLDRFDQEMKARRIRIVRYADDILIFARTKQEAGRYQQIATQFLEGELKLTVNTKKTHIASAQEGVTYLGFVIHPRYVAISQKKIKAFKDRIRQLTPRNHGMNVETMVKELNPVIRGWANYFRIANCKKLFLELAAWIRRRLRMKQMREWKSWKPLHKALRRRNYQGEFEKISMFRWRSSSSPLINMALPNSWLQEIGLVSLDSFEVGILSHFYEK